MTERPKVRALIETSSRWRAIISALFASVLLGSPLCLSALCMASGALPSRYDFSENQEQNEEEEDASPEIIARASQVGAARIRYQYFAYCVSAYSSRHRAQLMEHPIMPGGAGASLALVTFPSRLQL